MSRAQVQTQVFVFILVIIVVGVTFLFGYDAISKISNSGKEAQLEQFKSNLKNDIERIAPNFGSVEVKNYRVSGVTGVCFGSNDPSAVEGYADLLSASDKNLILTSVSSSTNVFLLKSPGIDSFFINGLDPSYSINCFKVNSGSIMLKIEGQGSYAKITIP